MTVRMTAAIAAQFRIFEQRWREDRAGRKVGDLLVGKRLDRTRLHSRTRCLCAHAGGENHASNDRPNLHLRSPEDLTDDCFASGAFSTALQAAGSCASVIGGFGFGGSFG